MDLAAQDRRALLRGRISKLVVAAIVTASAVAIVAPAQAANVGWAWGRNSSGQLGDGTNAGPETCNAPEEAACSTTPVEVSKLSGITRVAGGRADSIALLETHTVMAWGEGTLGQLGNGRSESSDVSVPVKELSGVAAIAAGQDHNLALLENGTVMAWGANSSGRLGDGSTANRDVPVAVCAVGEKAPCAGHLSGVTGIAGGGRHSLALLSNGTVVAWGANEEGQLGNGTTENSEVPVAVKGLSGVVAVSAGRSYSLALLSNGTVMAWGTNSFGQLGDGGTENSDVPLAVCAAGEKAPCAKALGSVKAISAGGDHALALLSNGTVMAWGNNGVGQLGDGSPTGPEGCGPTAHQACAKSPVGVSRLGGVAAIAGGGEHSLALLASGSVLAWGRNAEGELGDGTSTGPEHCGPFAIPCSTTPVTTLTRSVQLGISAGGEHSLAFGPPPTPPSNLPELGRCVPSAKKAGQWKGTICNHLAGGKGTHNWLPGAEKNKFTGSGTVTVLASPKLTISCAATQLAGEWTGAKTATATLVLKGCENAANEKPCQSSPAKAGEIESSMPLEGELGFINATTTRRSVGLDLKKSSKAVSLATVFCGSGPEPPEDQGNIEGSVIGQLKLVNKMVSAFTLAYKSAKGAQKPERFEGGLRDTLSFVFPPSGPEPPVTESANLSATVTITNEEPLEIKANTFAS